MRTRSSKTSEVTQITTAAHRVVRQLTQRGRTCVSASASPIEALEPRQLLTASVVINEFVASNKNGIVDRFNKHSDWIELYNASTSPADLTGWHLTDDPTNPAEWTFPARTMQPGGYLIVFANDNHDLVNPTSELDTNFGLSAGGEYLALTDANSTVVQEFNPFPAQLADISYGLPSPTASVDQAQYFTVPTPGAVNKNGNLGVVADTKFSVDRGFFDGPFQLTLKTATVGASIRYTTDGSAPSATRGTVYNTTTSPPIPISSTTIVRAIAYATGYLPTAVDSQTYIFLNQVLTQSNGNVPSFTDWGHDGADYGMDSTIVNDPRYSGEIKDDLKSIPSLSISMPWSEWFGTNGIYIKGSGDDRAAGIEMIQPDGSPGWDINGAVAIQGGSSDDRWKDDKLSLQLTFKDPFGPSKLSQDVFGGDATDKFDKIVLDSTLNYGWEHPQRSQSDAAMYTQDPFISNLQNAMDGPGSAPHEQWVHLYLNGLYWGMYHMHEKPDESFAAAYFGGDKTDYDVIKHTANDVVAGTGATYQTLLGLVRKDMTSSANYQAIADKLDLTSFVDYMILNFYADNTDWAHHNWYATYNRVAPGSKWHFHAWDSEIILQDVNDDTTGLNQSGSPTEIHQQLSANAEYRQLFADRVQKWMTGDGLLTPAKAAAAYQGEMDKINEAIVGESARWGDNRIQTSGKHYTRDNWLSTQNDLLNNFFPARTANVLAQFRTDSLFPTTKAPVFNKSGGTVASGFGLTLTNPGSGIIYYTTDGSDPRLPGGNKSSIAKTYSSPISITRAQTINARVVNGSTWSPIVTNVFAVDESALRVSEIMYHPANPPAGSAFNQDDFEYIELLNTGSKTLPLIGVKFNKGVDFNFPDVDLAPGDYALIVENQAAFESRYGTGLPVLGEYSGNLDNGGERLLLADAAETTILDFEYDDAWYPPTDGDGPSLVKIDPAGAPAGFGLAANWSASARSAGSPGVDDAPDLLAPTVDILDVSPDPTTAPVSSISIVFSEPVKHFDLPDLSLTRNGAPVALTGTTLTTADNKTFTLGNLSGITSPVGAYVLLLGALGSGITDNALNPLAGDASDGWQVIPPPTTALSIQLFNDLNANGTFDTLSGETTLGGRTLYIDADHNQQNDPTDPQATTDPTTGQATFSGLIAGTYTIRLDLPAGWSQTTPASGAGLVVTTAGESTLSGGSIGAVQNGTISGTVFEDLDGSGVQNGLETAIGGRLVYIESVLDGHFTPGELNQTTAPDGTYTFADLLPGSYNVRTVAPNNWDYTSPSAVGSVVTVASGATTVNVTFGTRAEAATIAGIVYNDLNGNGGHDAGEPQIAGTVFLDGDDDGTFDTGEATSGATATTGYQFSSLTPVTHGVGVIVPAGWIATQPASGFQTIPLAAGQTATVDFGIHQTAPQPVTLSASNDAYVIDGSSASKNFGLATELDVRKSSTTGSNRTSYLTFNLANISSFANVGTAKIRVFGKPSASSSSGVSVSLYTVSTTSWKETTLTWNNKPSTSSSAVGSTNKVTALGGAWYEWDVSSYLKAQKAAGKTSVSFAIKSGTSSTPYAIFNSDEAIDANTRPQLVVTPAPPTPISLRVTADAGVESLSSANTNAGSSSSLNVRKPKSSSTTEREAYLKFDLTSLKTISNATLRLNGKLNTAVTGGVLLGIYNDTDTAWSESKLTYNNRVLSDPTLLAQATINSTSSVWVEWDLTAYLQAQKAAGKTTITVVIKGITVTDSKAVFVSDEGSSSSRPALVVTP